MGLTLTDAHVGPRVGVQEGPRVVKRLEASIEHVENALLLLRPGVQEQHRPSAVEASQGLPHAADPLQAQARGQAICVPQVRQGVRGARGLAHPREELWQALVLHMWV